MVAQVHPAPPPVVDVDVERGAIVVTDVVSDDEDAVDDEPISPLPELPDLSHTPDASPPGSTRDLTTARVSIGHDARVAEEHEQKLLDSMGKPVRVQSVFRAVSGITTHYGDSPTGMHPKLTAVDEDAYGAKTWTWREMRNTAFYTFIHLLAFAALSYADPDSWWHRRGLGEVIGGVNDGVSHPTFGGEFWRKIAAQTAVFWTVLPLMGLLVVTRGWNVGYTRKICHIVTYLTPPRVQPRVAHDGREGVPAERVGRELVRVVSVLQLLPANQTRETALHDMHARVQSVRQSAGQAVHPHVDHIPDGGRVFHHHRPLRLLPRVAKGPVARPRGVFRPDSHDRQRLRRRSRRARGYILRQTPVQGPSAVAQGPVLRR